MKPRSQTAERILEASRKAFNKAGYVSTSVTEIAASLGMSQGNLTYHFPTKRDLAMALENDAVALMQEQRKTHRPGKIAEDYVAHMLFGMEVTWRYQFVKRDRIHYAGKPIGERDDHELTNSYGEMVTLLNRIQREGLFLRDRVEKVDALARSLWIVSRYWIDYLREMEGLEEIGWTDQERGIRNHFDLLLPCLKKPAQHQFEAALQRASAKHA